MTDARVRIRINIFLVAIAASYLTLGAANSTIASSLWWVYGVVSGALASANLVLAHRADRRRRRR